MAVSLSKLSTGQSVKPASNSDALARARLRAALVPDLLVEAQRISNTIVTGWHGRRRQGVGDSFWQFRPYNTGESMSRIDWRRSARDNAVTVRDQEWEAAHTVWVWADNSPSMLFQSKFSEVSKQSRAIVLALALTEVLARSGERVGWPGISTALSSRNAAERIATALVLADGAGDHSFPSTEHIKRRSELVIISDFLDPVDDILERIHTLAQSGVRGMLIHVVDPVEESFPYTGRTEFRDPETGHKLTAGRAETLIDEYQTLFTARQSILADHCAKLGWHHIVHHTDHLASSVLVAAHTRLSGHPEQAA